jgi:hypothetical protein
VLTGTATTATVAAGGYGMYSVGALAATYVGAGAVLTPVLIVGGVTVAVATAVAAGGTAVTENYLRQISEYNSISIMLLEVVAKKCDIQAGVTS